MMRKWKVMTVTVTLNNFLVILKKIQPQRYQQYYEKNLHIQYIKHFSNKPDHIL